MGCSAVIVVILLIILMFGVPELGLALSIMGIIGIIIAAFMSKNNAKEKKLEDERRTQMEQRTEVGYEGIRASIAIPQNAKIVRKKGTNTNLKHPSQYLWIEDGCLCFFPLYDKLYFADEDITKLAVYKLPIERVEYYYTEGDVFRENKISGGGGGGSSIGGAVAGAVIAGDAGAVIGSRKRVAPIKSELVTHDTRETIVNYFDEEGNRNSMNFSFEDKITFEDLIPEKSYEIVNAIKNKNIIERIENDSKEYNIPEKIRDLAKLRDEGILTEEEFSQKKKVLLDKI